MKHSRVVRFFLDIISELSDMLTDFLVHISLFLLITSWLLIGTVMTIAYQHGYLPPTPWSDWPGNHGPWHFTFFFPCYRIIRYFRDGLDLAFLLLLISVRTSFSSIFMAFSLRRVILFSLCLISFLLNLYCFSWLVD